MSNAYKPFIYIDSLSGAEKEFNEYKESMEQEQEKIYASMAVPKHMLQGPMLDREPSVSVKEKADLKALAAKGRIPDKETLSSPMYPTKEEFDRMTTITPMKEKDMTDEQQSAPKPKPGLLVEDTSVVGGTDKATGQPVVRPRTPDGTADKLTEATDKRENAK